VAFCRRCDRSAGLCEGSAFQRAIWHEAHPVRLAFGEQVGPARVREVERALHGRDLDDRACDGQLLHRDVADPDVEHLAFLLQISHRPDRLLQGDVAHVDKERARHPINTRPSSATPKELEHQAISPSRGRVPRTRTSTAPSSHAPTPKRPNGGWVGR
jgi:hypothetical protein